MCTTSITMMNICIFIKDISKYESIKPLWTLNIKHAVCETLILRIESLSGFNTYIYMKKILQSSFFQNWRMWPQATIYSTNALSIICVSESTIWLKESMSIARPIERRTNDKVRLEVAPLGRPTTVESCLHCLPPRTATVAASATQGCFPDERRWSRARLPCLQTDGLDRLARSNRWSRRIAVDLVR